MFSPVMALILDCQKEGVVYQISCEECDQEGRSALYIGETSRTPYLRGLEHQAALRLEDEESPLVKHVLKYHQGGRIGWSN